MKKVAWVILAVICFVSFLFDYDLNVLIVSGNFLLQGHILDYYECIATVIGDGGIYPILYPILFAIWNLPIFVCFGAFTDIHQMPIFVLLWNKLFLVICYYITGVIIQKIIKRDYYNGSNIPYWFYMPLAFFTVFIMGLYDVVYVMFMTAALYYYNLDWEENRLYKYRFIILFGITICFKTLTAIYFVAFLLIREKKVIHIVKSMILFVIPYFLCAVPYLSSDKFINNCLMFSSRARGMFLNFKLGDDYLFVILLIVVYSFVYFFIDYGKIDKFKVILVANAISCIMFGLIDFHPQWIIIASPYVAIALAKIGEKDNANLMAVVYVIGVLYFFKCALEVQNGTNELLALGGLFGGHGLDILVRENLISMSEIYPIKDIHMVRTVLLSLLIIYIMLLYRWDKQICQIVLNPFCCFMCTILLFVLPAFISIVHSMMLTAIK